MEHDYEAVKKEVDAIKEAAKYTGEITRKYASKIRRSTIYETCVELDRCIRENFSEKPAQYHEIEINTSDRTIKDRTYNVDDIAVFYLSVLNYLGCTGKFVIYNLRDCHFYGYIEVETEKGNVILNTDMQLAFDQHISDYIKEKDL